MKTGTIQTHFNLAAYLSPCPIVDFEHPDIQAKAQQLADGCNTELAIAQRCFEFVRDEIRHSGDHKDAKTTVSASEVLNYGGGWCYAKSHLLAALLRANDIPTGLCYQRLDCSDYHDDSAPIFCLHGLNAIYLSATETLDAGWYRVDARGNRDDINAQFTPPKEQLAFVLKPHEQDLPTIYAKPLPNVVNALIQHGSYEQIIDNFPDQ